MKLLLKSKHNFSNSLMLERVMTRKHPDVCIKYVWMMVMIVILVRTVG